MHAERAPSGSSMAGTHAQRTRRADSVRRCEHASATGHLSHALPVHGCSSCRAEFMRRCDHASAPEHISRALTDYDCIGGRAPPCGCIGGRSPPYGSCRISRRPRRACGSGTPFARDGFPLPLLVWGVLRPPIPTRTRTRNTFPRALTGHDCIGGRSPPYYGCCRIARRFERAHATEHLSRALASRCRSSCWADFVRRFERAQGDGTPFRGH